MYLGESRRSFVNTFLNFGKDKEHNVYTYWHVLLPRIEQELFFTHELHRQVDGLIEILLL